MTFPIGPIRSIVADDEPLARSAMRTLLAGTPGVTVCGEAADGNQALAMIAAAEPDVAFLDIKMPEPGGLEVARRLRMATPPAIVFVTAYDEFALAAFEARAIDYLLKPVDPTRLAAALDRVRWLLAQQATAKQLARVVTLIRELEGLGSARNSPSIVDNRQSNQAGSRPMVDRVDPTTTEWIESARNYAKLHLPTRTILIRRTIADLENELDPRAFVRVHRTAIVNRAKIVHIWHAGRGEYCLRLASGRELRIGRTFRSRVLDAR